MPSPTEARVPKAAQPKPSDYAFDLERALRAVVAVHSLVPEDAFSATTLGTERTGHGVLIDENIVLTIGYLVTEAETIWLHLHDGRVVPGHVLGIDTESGFGLVQALDRIDIAPLKLGDSSRAGLGDAVVMGGLGGVAQSVAAKIAARQEFAGYWEYLLDDALFTYPTHPNWGGAPLISAQGELLGIGSLQIEREQKGKTQQLNMVVPIDLLKPVLDDLRTRGRPDKPPRPWLGVYAAEIENRVVVVGIVPRGPASRAELKTGDVILRVKGETVSDAAEFYRRLWALGSAGIDVPLTLYREGDTFEVDVVSTDRARMMKAPRLH